MHVKIALFLAKTEVRKK